MRTEPRWWAAPGGPDNHNFVLGPSNIQRCHLCSEVEPPLRVPSGDERTDRAAAHMVHGVRAHLDATAKEWNA